MKKDLDTVGSIAEPWKSWLGEWRDNLDHDLPVIFYEDDGLDAPDEFEPGPHLAIRSDSTETIPGAEHALIWPVDVEGWADIRKLGWRGVLPLLDAGKRMEDDDGH